MMRPLGLALVIASLSSTSWAQSIPTWPAREPYAVKHSPAELAALAIASLSSKRALVWNPDTNAYEIALRFVVGRGCEQTFALTASPETLPKLFPRIKAFHVRRALDDGFLVDAQEGFIGVPLTYPVRMVLSEFPTSTRTVRIHSVDDAMQPTETVGVTATLRDVFHPNYCHVEFRAVTHLPPFVPDAAVSFAIGYSEDEIAFAIRDALTQHPPWPASRHAPLLTPRGRRLAAAHRPNIEKIDVAPKSKP